MALNTFKGNCLTPLHFKGLTNCDIITRENVCGRASSSRR